MQSQDVMAAVQSLRATARSNGALKSNQYQTVVESGDTIIIESPSPEVIYVPSYQPAVVYAPPVYGYSSSDMFWSNAISFGAGVVTGAILANNIDCDWHGGCIGWGHHEIDIDREINIGEININQNNINNVRNKLNSGNRIGNEGTAWRPNPGKVNTEQLKQRAQTGSLQKFRGASEGTAKSLPRIPNRNPGEAPLARTRQSGSGREWSRANRGDVNRPGAADRIGGADRTPGVNRPAPPKAPSIDRTRIPDRPGAAPPKVKPRTPEAPKARPAPQPSGFSMDRGAAAHSARGHASRGTAGAHRGAGGRAGARR